MCFDVEIQIVEIQRFEISARFGDMYNWFHIKGTHKTFLGNQWTFNDVGDETLAV